MNMASEALKCVKLGFSVFPVWPMFKMPDGRLVCGCFKNECENPGKHPIGRLVPQGVLNASREEDRIRHWWRMRPDANIGAATGYPLICVDIDPRSMAATKRSIILSVGTDPYHKRGGALPGAVASMSFSRSPAPRSGFKTASARSAMVSIFVASTAT